MKLQTRLAAVAMAGALATGLLAAPTQAAPTMPQLKGAIKVKPLSDEFKGSALSTRWAVFTGPGEAGKSIANYTLDSVKLGGGKLSLTTARRCGSVTGPIRNKCKNPVYTSGRINSSLGTLPKGDFRIAFRAKLPDKPLQGTRWALWLKNDQGYCANGSNAKQGELDVLEYYGRQANRNQSFGVSHLSCTNKGAGNQAYQDSNQVTFSRTGWHTWSVERRGGTLTYRVDSKVVGRTVCGKGTTMNVSKNSCKQIFEQTNWSFIIQGEVFSGERAANDAKQAAPRPGKAFPQQTMQVDWLRVFKL